MKEGIDAIPRHRQAIVFREEANIYMSDTEEGLRRRMLDWSFE
jgi:hypothetical protein